MGGEALMMKGCPVFEGRGGEALVRKGAGKCLFLESLCLHKLARSARKMLQKVR